jgi:putative oxidoreductase
MNALLVAARILFSLVFVLCGLDLFDPDAAAWLAAQGVPAAKAVGAVAGTLAIWGGGCVACGWHARGGAGTLAVLLSLAALLLAAADGLLHTQFLSCLSLLGGALLIVYFGPGPWSVDEGRERRRQAHMRPAKPSDLSRNLSLTLLGGRKRR